MPDPILKLVDVTVRFGALRAVDGVQLAVDRGERRAVIGPNGAGKTTLFNAITGVFPPSSGKVFFEGRDITRAPPHRRAAHNIARTFQITNVFPNLTVDENMQLALRGLGTRKFSLFGSSRFTASEQDRRDRAIELARLGSRQSAVVKDMSYGEQRQLELALALAAAPRLLLLDEPAAGLSPSERTIVADIVHSLPRDITVVLIEHDMDLVLRLVDRVTCMHNGRVLVEGAPDDIRGNLEVQEVYLGKARHHG
jgi:branched-chain amino acid transport system ATP-binding protein